MSVHELRGSLEAAIAGALPEAMMRLADRGAQLSAVLQAKGATRHAQIMQFAVDRLVEDRNVEFLLAAFNLKLAPPTIEEFLDDPQFWRDRMNIWPLLRPHIIETNPYPFLTTSQVDQWIAGGGTGTGKTATAHTTQAYHLTLLHCMREPQALYGVTKSTPLEFKFLSVSEKTIKDVVYRPFRLLYTSMPWAIKETSWDSYNESQLIFSNNLQVDYALADVTNIVGRALISSINDEVNFMAIVEESRKVTGNRGQGGRYDQAEIICSEVLQRRESRAVGKGPLPGVTCILSSTRYKNDYVDRRQAQVANAEALGRPEPRVKVFRACRFDVQPQSRFGGENWREDSAIRVLVGSERNPTRILEDHEKPGEDYPETATVRLVPETFRASFTNNPEDALRNILGIASDAISAFIVRRDKITDAFARGKKLGLRSFLENDHVDFLVEGMPVVDRRKLPTDLETRRFVHVDLSTTTDRCGIAMIRVAGTTQVPAAFTDEGEPTMFEVVPYYVVEMACSIQPSKVRELDPSDVRLWIMNLRDYHGLNIYQVSYDGYNSDESIRLFRKAGIRSKNISMDKTKEPYEYLRSTMYQDRCDMVENELLRVEFAQLEHNENRKPGQPLINHPPSGSKDIADAVCGAIYAASINRSERAELDVVKPSGQSVRNSDESRRRDFTRRR